MATGEKMFVAAILTVILFVGLQALALALRIGSGVRSVQDRSAVPAICSIAAWIVVGAGGTYLVSQVRLLRHHRDVTVDEAR
jgi:protein-S-isoprenylcysteine O-methyltransferase Ste14